MSDKDRKEDPDIKQEHEARMAKLGFILVASVLDARILTPIISAFFVEIHSLS